MIMKFKVSLARWVCARIPVTPGTHCPGFYCHILRPEFRCTVKFSILDTRVREHWTHQVFMDAETTFALHVNKLYILFIRFYPS